MGDLEWTNDLVIRLMQEYEKRRELWDSSHEMYRVQSLKYQTWRELASTFDCDITDLRKKLNSLFASHRREKGKIRAGGRSTWFLYPFMSFLPSHIDCEAGAAEAPTTPTSKSRFPVKEVAPPSGSDDDQDYSGEAEFLEEEEELQPQTVLIKEEAPREPAGMAGYSDRRLKRGRGQVQARARATRPVRRCAVREAPPPARAAASLDGRLAETLKLLRRSELARQKDECDSFGEYIADSLRKHDDRTQSMIKQAINNILFEQEMKKYSANQQFVVISGIDENPLILGDESDK